jgi:hypothetical protein
MRHAVVAARTSLILAALLITACKGGAVDNAADYQTAMKSFEMSYNKVKALAHESRTRGDPQLLAQAFESLMPALEQMSAAAQKVKVEGPDLTPLHADLTAAVDDYVSTLNKLNEKVRATPLIKSKTVLAESGEAIATAVEAWREGLSTL